jgi:polyhydroxyalkanoate synthesis regulator phasin
MRPADSPTRVGEAGDDRSALARLLLAGLGAAALTGERADQLADVLARRAGIGRDEALELLREVADGWRREAGRIGDRTADAAQRFVRDLGLVTHEELEDLELRLAQLEHRLRLLERAPQ